METDNKTKSNLLILLLSLLLLGLISIFYVGAPGKKPAPPSVTGQWTRPLTDKEIREFGKNADPKTNPKPLTDTEIARFGRNADPKSNPKPLTDEEITSFGKNSR